MLSKSQAAQQISTTRPSMLCPKFQSGGQAKTRSQIPDNTKKHAKMLVGGLSQILFNCILGRERLALLFKQAVRQSKNSAIPSHCYRENGTGTSNQKGQLGCLETCATRALDLAPSQQVSFRVNVAQTNEACHDGVAGMYKIWRIYSMAYGFGMSWMVLGIDIEHLWRTAVVGVSLTSKVGILLACG